MISLQDWPSNAQDYQDGSGHWSDGTWGDDSWTSGWAKDQEYYGWKGDDQQGHNKYGSWAADWQQDDGILTQEVKCENVVNSDSGTQEDDPVTLQNDKAEPDEQWLKLIWMVKLLAMLPKVPRDLKLMTVKLELKPHPVQVQASHSLVTHLQDGSGGTVSWSR